MSQAGQHAASNAGSPASILLDKHMKGRLLTQWVINLGGCICMGCR